MSNAVFDDTSADDKDQLLKLDVLDALRDFIGSEPLQHYLSDFILHSTQHLHHISMAIAGENGTGIRHLAHKLKGTSGNIGALKLAWCCVELEAASANGCAQEILKDKYQQLEHASQETQRAIQAYIDGLLSVREYIG
jgi:HPt (histidine-containing phosphotransfer) domain-containing protein